MRVISKRDPSENFGNIIQNPNPLWKNGFTKLADLRQSLFSDLRKTFGSADYVDGYTVFDVGGNKYRISTVIHYDKQRLYVRQVMTHAEYDRNDWRKNERGT